MKSINFNAGIGVKEYSVNGSSERVIRLNVLDVNLYKRICSIEADADEIVKKYGHIDENLSHEEQSTIAAEADVEIRKLFNKAFGADICTPAFGDVNCLSPVDSTGKPLYQEFFEAFIPVVIEDIKAAMPKPQDKPEVRKYLPQAEAPKAAKPQIKPVAGLSQPYGIDASTLTKEQRAALIAQLLA